jgi:thioredoxin 1
MENYVEVSNDEFDVTGKDLKIVAFKAAWCGPCRVLSPILEELAGNNKELIVAKVDVDSNPELSAKYGIRNIPTTLFLRNGEIVDKVIGVKSLADLQNLVNVYS